jgi:protein gp37
MAETTAIEWCDSTFNPWIGCTRVSPACNHCYAAVSTPARSMRIEWGPHAPRHRTAASTWKQPVRWEREHEAFQAEHGRRRRVFCASLADVFDNEVPAEWRLDLFRMIRATPHLDWLLLTKRIGNAPIMLANVRLMADEYIDPFPWPNVRIGATMVNQEEWDRDSDKLLALGGSTFASLEPLLGPIDMRGRLPGWVIVGGESGPKARPMHPDWARSLSEQCRAAGVPFFMKQMGGHPDKRANMEQFPPELRMQEVPT